MSNLLKDALDIYTKEDLRDYAKQLDLRGISSYRKSELAEKIANELMSPDVMRKNLIIPGKH
ncbi:MAG: Rho termination factor N-terminal domain-containing protein [Eubacteriales bacterium]|nr:Rho termination factor N-terminal domain-containing protein [Eubacteriales bacterium]